MISPGLISNPRLLSNQVKLPPDKRYNHLLVEFEQPIAEYHCREFLRIGLSENMRIGAEELPFNVEVYKPSLAPRKCVACAVQLSPRGLYRAVCENRKCQRQGKETNWQPTQGVQKLVYFDDFYTHVDKGVEYVKACVLMLDRRYEEPVLAAIKRTACELGSEMGWSVS